MTIQAKFLDWSRINSKENFANLGIQSPPVSGEGRKHDRIRVGYFSVDFRNHPVAHLTAPLYGLHDSNKFEVWVYSYGPDDKSSSSAKAFKMVLSIL